MSDPVTELLRYDPALRCRCETRFDRCVRRATGDDGHCEGCRDVRPNGGSREHRIELIPEDVMRHMPEDPETAWTEPAHYAVVTQPQIDAAWALGARLRASEES